MIEVHGKLIPTTSDEVVYPMHTALVNIDLQNDFCSSGGVSDRKGLDISMPRAIIPNVAKVQAAARKAGMLIIHTQNSTLPAHRSDSAAWLRFKMKNIIPKDEDDYSPDGSWGNDFVDEVRPQAGDIVIKKYRSDAFEGTPLDLVLRSNGVKTVVITGVVTQGCVESTARAAAFHDYFVAVVRDCVATTNREYHEPSLKIMEYRFDVVTSEELIAAWRRSTG